MQSQVYQSKTSFLKKRVNSLKSCQLCQSPGHVATEYSNIHLVKDSKNYVIEDAYYSRHNVGNQGYEPHDYPRRNTGFIRKLEHPPLQGQYYQGKPEPYRPLGFRPQEPVWLDLEINLERVITRVNADLEHKLG